MASSASLKSQLDALNGNLKKKKERLNTVNKVKSNLEKNYDDDIDNVNKYIGNAYEHFIEGLYGNDVVSSNYSEINNGKQNADYSDSFLSSAEGSLQAEIDKLNSEISSLESDIKTTTSQYNAAVAAEKEAARKAQEEAAKRAAQEAAAKKTAQAQTSQAKSSSTSSKASSSSASTSSSNNSSSTTTKKKNWWWPF